MSVGAGTPAGLGARSGNPADTRLDELVRSRREADRSFFDANAGRLAECCREIAERFGRGGRLIAVGASPAERSDVRHVTVEFVHPVIVGKRALPALGLAPGAGSLAAQALSLTRRADIVIAFGDAGRLRPEVAEALDVSTGKGCLGIAFASADAEWVFEVADDDPFVRQEVVETAYHLLWELVHVFFEHGVGRGGDAERRPDPGSAGFLYPFLGDANGDSADVVEDVRDSVLAKAEEIAELRARTLLGNRDALIAIAGDLRRCFDSGGKVLAFGNGGSATDAADLVADLRFPPAPGPGAAPWPSRPALDLTEDSAVLTALANDIGVEEVFQRQVIAHGEAGDVAVAISTSGDSANLIEALVAARLRGMTTVALLGYEGGRIAAEGLADRIVIARSQHIPRIQEAQASAYHAVRELAELAG